LELRELLKRAFIFLLKKPIQTLLLLILVTLIFSFEFSGILLYQSTEATRLDTLRQIGAKITISPNQNYQEIGAVYEPATNELLDSILKIPHVMGYDASNAQVEGPCEPINFNNVKKHTGVDPYTQNAAVISESDALIYQNCINILGSNDISLTNQFRRHLSKIINGDYPTETNKGVLISSELANENHLSVGDELKLQFIRGDNTKPEKAVKIVGIYETMLKFEILSTNDMGIGIFQGSPYNLVFADYSTACSVTGHNGDITFFSIYIDSPEYITKVSSDVSNLPIRWDQYQINNSTQRFYNEYAGQLNNLIDKSRALILFSMGAGLILFLMVISFWNKNYINDMGILISLGESKKKIILQKFVEYLIIAVIGVALSIPIGYLTVTALSVPLTPKVIASNAENIRYFMYTGEDDIVQTLHIIVNWLSILKITVFGVVFVLISTIIPISLTLRYNARQIFAKSE
jgi:putative ABC transport system permease protein